MSLTDLMATELIAPEIGVRVNSIAPGLFPSESKSASLSLSLSPLFVGFAR